MGELFINFTALSLVQESDREKVPPDQLLSFAIRFDVETQELGHMNFQLLTLNRCILISCSHY